MHGSDNAKKEGIEHKKGVEKKGKQADKCCNRKRTEVKERYERDNKQIKK